MTLDQWEEQAGDLTSLTLNEMRRLFAECPSPDQSERAALLWRLIVAMVHTRRGADDRPSDWTLRSLDQDSMMPVH